jgi:TPR repeat protein
MYYYGKGASVDYKRSFGLFKSIKVKWESVSEKSYVYVQDDSNWGNSQNDIIHRTINLSELKGENRSYLGLMYKHGQGVRQDQKKSQDYFKEAFNYGCKRARHKIV